MSDQTMKGARRTSAGFFVALFLVTAAIEAAPAPQPVISVMTPTCMPEGGNGPITATISSSQGLSSVRAYFRKNEDKTAGKAEGAFYYVEMRSAGNDAYWAVLPRPEDRTAIIDYFVAVRDGEGRETKSARQKVNVTGNCKPVLTPAQARFAQNLVVGETDVKQNGELVYGFECNGIISRIDVAGRLWSDERCRKAIIAAISPLTRALVPLVIVGGAGAAIVIIKHDEKGEASKARP